MTNDKILQETYDPNAYSDASPYAHAFMMGEPYKRVKTGYGDKSIVGIHAMLSNPNIEDTADALLNGKTTRKTTFGTKSREGIIDMIKRHQEHIGKKVNEAKDSTYKLRMQAIDASIHAYENPSVATHTDAYELHKKAYLESPDVNANKDWHRDSMRNHLRFLSDEEKSKHKEQFGESVKDDDEEDETPEAITKPKFDDSLLAKMFGPSSKDVKNLDDKFKTARFKGKITKHVMKESILEELSELNERYAATEIQAAHDAFQNLDKEHPARIAYDNASDDERRKLVNHHCYVTKNSTSDNPDVLQRVDKRKTKFFNHVNRLAYGAAPVSSETDITPYLKKKRVKKVVEDFDEDLDEDLDESRGHSIVAKKLQQMNLQSMPLLGHPYHKKSDAELDYIIKDAGESAKAFKGEQVEGKYLDQVNDASTIKHYREKARAENGGTLPSAYTKKYLSSTQANESLVRSTIEKLGIMEPGEKYSSVLKNIGKETLFGLKDVAGHPIKTAKEIGKDVKDYVKKSLNPNG